jgi:hypothetical protein
MPSRPDLREIATNVKEAFADADKETLLDVLTFVVKEYVVEGPPPMLMHQAETLSDLQGMSFAQLIAALQTRFDHPELAMFVVDGESVGVRIGGVVQPLLPGRTPPAQAAADQLRAAGVRVVETQLSPRPPQQQPPAQTPQPPPQRQEGAAPPPVRGLSISGRPSGSAAPTPPAQPPAQQGQQQPAPPAQPQQGAPQAAPQEKPEGSGDDASTRFGLLELD